MKRIYIAGCGGMLGEAFYKQFKDEYELMCTDIDINDVWLPPITNCLLARLRQFQGIHRFVCPFVKHRKGGNLQGFRFPDFT